jgi:2-dehydropantoate 2-reductase
MRVCVYGVGAIGGAVAARLIRGGAAEISVVARGAALAAVANHGLTLKLSDEELRVHPSTVTDDPAALPPQQLVIVALKAFSVPAIAGQLRRLLAPGAVALFLLNGIPWWWNHGQKGGAGTLPLLDPEGALWRELGPEQALGAVVHASHTLLAPGIVSHSGGNLWLFGEPDGSLSSRLETAVALFKAAGLGAGPTRDLRREIWRKLIGNAAINPLSALTRLTLDGFANDADLVELSAAVMREILDIAAALGWDLRNEIDVDAMKAPPVRAKGAKPSMLQDIESGRPTEVEAILGQTHAFAHQVRIHAPVLSMLLTLMRSLDRAPSRFTHPVLL